MKYSLKDNVEQWKARLANASMNQFDQQLKFFLDNLNKHKKIISILNDAKSVYPYTSEKLDEIINQLGRDADLFFENELHHATFCHQLITYFVIKFDTYKIHTYYAFGDGSFDKSRPQIIENFISPISNYLTDRLEKSNSIMYLLEKYKKRTEWFTKQALVSSYKSVTKNYEKIFEDDLRLFLFDQGIEYPFSTPQSTSGRADIVGEMETDDPLVLEIKIFDKEKEYGKKRVISGFSQIVKYANDYNKREAYLIIFNFDQVELSFSFQEPSSQFPPTLSFNSKTFYFIVINLNTDLPASKIGKLDVVEFKTDELIS
jgi:hypothetical protein